MLESTFSWDMLPALCTTSGTRLKYCHDESGERSTAYLGCDITGYIKVSYIVPGKAG